MDVSRFAVLVSEIGSHLADDPDADGQVGVHTAVLRAACAGHGGEVSTDGARVVAWFSSVADALRAAVEAASHLPFHGIEAGSRMAVNARSDGVSDDRAVIADAVRLCASAPPGQVLLGASTAQLAADATKDGGSFEDLGPHRLTDLLPPRPLVRLRHPRLVDDDAPPVTLDARSHNLPVYAARHIAREREVADVLSAVLDPDVRVVTLAGPGGIGKTRLACHAAAEALPHLPDGAWFVPLADIRDPDLVAVAIAQTLEVRVAANEPPIDAIVRTIAARHMLLVLDNFEQVMPAVAFVDAIAARCPLAVVAVTSRQALRLPREKVFTVEPMNGDGVALLIDRARLADPRFVLRPADEDVASEICRRLDGLPLAIEIAAARLKTLSPSEVLERLSLKLPLADRPERHRTLEGAIAWSFDLLDASEQRLFCALSVFADGFRVDDAENVCARVGLDVVEGIATLAEQSLIVRDSASEGPARHRMLQTIREFATERLAPADANELRAVHARRFVELVIEAGPHVRGPDEAAWIDRLDAETGNLRGALEWLETHDPPAFTDLAAKLVWFWRTRGYLFEATAWLDRALAVFREPGAERSALLIEKGKVALSTSDYTSGRRLFGQGLEMARTFGASDVLVEAIHGLATVELALGNPDAAGAHYNEELELALAQGDARGESWAHIGLGIIADQRGSLDEAREHYEQALEIYRRSGDTRGQAIALANIAHSYDEQGDYARALSYYEESLAMNRSIGFRAGVASNLQNLSTVLMAVGRLDDAEARCAEAATTCREIGDRGGLGAALQALGELLLRRGDLDRSKEALLEALEIQRDHKIPRDILATLGSLGDVALAAGRVEEARRLYEEKLSVSKDISYRGGEIGALLGIASVQRANGDIAAAAEALDTAETLAREVDDHQAPMLVASVRAEIARDQGDLLGAARLHLLALRFYVGAGENVATASTLSRLSWIAALTGSDVTALRLHGAALADRGSALAIDDQLEDQRFLARARARLGAKSADDVAGSGRAMGADEALREVEGLVDSLAAAPTQRAASAAGDAEFRLDGDVWIVSFDNATAHVKDARGMKSDSASARSRRRRGACPGSRVDVEAGFVPGGGGQRRRTLG